MMCDGSFEIGPLDRQQVALLDAMASATDTWENQRAIALFCGAAAAAAMRFAEEDELEASLTERERQEWGAFLHVLMRLADYCTVSGWETTTKEGTPPCLQAGRVGAGVRIS